MLEPLEFDALPDTLQTVLRARVERLGYLGDFFRYTAHQPEALAHFYAFTESLKNALPNDLAEVIALSVASRKGSEYERNQHQQLASRLGFATNWILALCGDAPELDVLTEDQQAVRSLALAVADDEPARSRPALAQVTRLLGQETAVAALLLSARSVAHAAVSNALNLKPPVDSIPQPSLSGEGTPRSHDQHASTRRTA